MLDNLKILHDAIVSGLRAKIAGMEFIDAYPKLGRKIPTPCVVIELSEMEPGHDPGTGQTSLIGRFQARAIGSLAVHPSRGYQARSLVGCSAASRVRGS